MADSRRERALALMGELDRSLEHADRQALLDGVKMKQEAFRGVMMNVIGRFPALVDCEPASFRNACLRGLELGVYPDGEMAAIIPFRGGANGKKAQFVLMKKGLLMIVRRHNPGCAINSAIAFQGDEWEDVRGSQPVLRHIRNPDVEESLENLLAAYATCHFPNNPMPETEVVYRAELLKMKEKGGASAWKDWPLRMAETKALRRLLTKIPGPPALLQGLYGHSDGETDVVDGEYEEVSEPPKVESKPRKKKPEPEPAAEQEELVPPPDANPLDEPPPNISDF